MADAKPASFDPSDVKTLIVGDNAFERRLIHDLLIALGVKEIIQAQDAMAAFAQMMLRRPRLIIADAEMRPASGLALAREIRTVKTPHRNIPLILFTSESSPELAQAGKEAGAHEVIAKPVSAEALRRCLQHAMTQPRDFTEISNKPRRTLRMPDTPPAKTGLDRAARAEVFLAVEQARSLVAQWETAGEPALIANARTLIQTAGERALAGGGDVALVRALAGALRLAEAALQGRADPHLLDVTLAAARALLAPGDGRMAMREALAEAVNEAAESRKASG
jgi:CheY-like chemotaxis protein